jgi:Flp pilus assembly protein TadD
MPQRFTPDESVLRSCAALGDQFLVRVMEVEVARRPRHAEAWAELGHALTRLGEHARALVADARVVELAPEDPTAHYNLACSLALSGRTDDAYGRLERAIELGWDDAEHMVADEDLASLRGQPRFEALLARLRRA